MSCEDQVELDLVSRGEESMNVQREVALFSDPLQWNYLKKMKIPKQQAERQKALNQIVASIMFSA
jgi:hypothetical protein